MFDDTEPADCPADCDGPCCVTVAQPFPMSAPLRMSTVRLVGMLAEAGEWSAQRIVLESSALQTRADDWRRWSGRGEPAGGVRIQTPRWTAFYVPVARVLPRWHVPANLPFLSREELDSITF